MSLFAGDDGRLHAEIAPSGDDERFTMRSALLVLRVWRESPEIVRCSLHHPASGTTAYVQGSEELAELSNILQLEVTR
jgi:hypothetical protein